MDVEFVHSAPEPEDSGGVESADEIIEAGRPRRWNRAVNVLAALAVLAGGAGYLVTRHGDGAPTAITSTAPSPKVTTDELAGCPDTLACDAANQNQQHFLDLLQKAMAERNADQWPVPRISFPACRAGKLCVVTTDLPKSAGAAVRHAFPHGDLATATTVTSGGGLWFRSVQASIGHLHLAIEVNREGQTATGNLPSSDPDYSVGTTYVQHMQGHFVVRVQVQGPLDLLPSVSSVSGLAADQRLVQAG